MIINRLPELVQRNSLSLSKLSKLTGLTRKTIVKLYYANFTGIHIDVLDKLCEALHTTPGDILQYKPGNHSKYPVLEELPEHTHPQNKRVEKALLIDDLVQED